jgi:hypothetical protein
MAGLDIGIRLLMLLSLLGAAMLVLLAWAQAARLDRQARRVVLLPVTLPRARRGPMRMHRDELLMRACGATRAPPPCLPPQPPEPMRRNDLPRAVRRR